MQNKHRNLSAFDKLTDEQVDRIGTWIAETVPYREIEKRTEQKFGLAHPESLHSTFCRASLRRGSHRRF